MKIAVLGTGQVGSAVARKLVALGHTVTLGSRTPDSETVRAVAASTGAAVETHAEAAARGDWLVNALPGERAIDVLRSCATSGKILVDIGNYDHAVDRPIEVPLGEAIQAALPDLKVVKTLNSVSAHLMVDPQSLPGGYPVFIASNDAAAKAKVTTLLESFGWRDILDLGDLSACRAMEQLIPLWMRLEATLGGPDFAISVVRRQRSATAP